MFLKKTVDAENIAPQIWFALGVAEVEYRRVNVPLIVTSLRDGTHGTGSKHYSGHAADLRTRYLTQQEQTDVFGRLKNILNFIGFDVVLEKDHIHIEWDPHKGDQPWLPEVA